MKEQYYFTSCEIRRLNTPNVGYDSQICPSRKHFTNMVKKLCLMLIVTIPPTR